MHTVRGLLVVWVVVACVSCDGGANVDAGVDDAARVCVDGCNDDDDCVIGGHGAACVDGVCESPSVDGQPACVNDDDCDLLVATFSGTREFRCERTSDCQAPGYSGPCVVGHSSGVALCGAPFFAIAGCNGGLLAREKNAGETRLCLAARSVCAEGQCHAVDACAGGSCACGADSDCDALYTSSAAVCR